MRDVETIVREVDSSMAMEGMPLYAVLVSLFSNVLVVFRFFK